MQESRQSHHDHGDFDWQNLSQAQAFWPIWPLPHRAAHYQHQMHQIRNCAIMKRTRSHCMSVYVTFLWMPLWVQQHPPTTMVTEAYVVLPPCTLMAITPPTHLLIHKSGTTSTTNSFSLLIRLTMRPLKNMMTRKLLWLQPLQASTVTIGLLQTPHQSWTCYPKRTLLPMQVILLFTLPMALLCTTVTHRLTTMIATKSQPTRQ